MTKNVTRKRLSKVKQPVSEAYIENTSRELPFQFLPPRQQPPGFQRSSQDGVYDPAPSSKTFVRD